MGAFGAEVGRAALAAEALAAADAALLEPKMGSAGDVMPEATTAGVAGPELGGSGMGEASSLTARLAGGAVAQTCRSIATRSRRAVS